MAARQPSIPLQDMTDDDRQAWIKKAPVPVRQYIDHLESEIEELEEAAAEEVKVQDYDDELGTLWTLLAARRMGCGDVAGFTRAERAARLVGASDGRH